MIVYNVTVNVENDAHDEWLKWMREKHIPDVVNTGCFSSGSIFRILVDEESGTSYSIQYRSPNRAAIDRYLKDFAPALRADAEKNFGGKFVAFRTLLEEVL